MKIGLLTYHHSMNYGAVLQTYATCRALEELGHEVELIDFRQPEKPSNWWLPFYFKVKAFERFKTKYYAPYSDYISSMIELENKQFDYDCLMVGSDQTWNPNINQERRMAYFLSWASEKYKKLSYASSLGVSEWPKRYLDDIPIIKEALSRFSAVSVREQTGRKLLKETFGIESTVVLDPTLLHRDYSELIGDISMTDDVICCLLHRSPSQLEKVRELDACIGKKAKVISTIRPIHGFKYIYPPSIESWLRYIACARLVITDSFHGVAFSLIFQKEFVVITPDTGKNSRLKDILDTLNLSDRYYLDCAKIDYAQIVASRIDYNKVNNILQKERDVSWTFLRENLS